MAGTVVYIVAGGEGRRMGLMTRDRAKPAIPFLHVYRIMDCVFSNLYNSGFDNMYMIVQHEFRSQRRHAEYGYCPLLGKSIDEFLLPPLDTTEGGRYVGTADAVAKNLHIVERQSPDHVLIFNADHVFVMDVREMTRWHEVNNADITIAVTRVPVAEAARNFGVVSVDETGRVIGFKEKSEHPTPIPGDPEFCYASLGNYDFTSDALLMGLFGDRSGGDLAQNVIAPAVRRGARVFAYNIAQHTIPGAIQGYWQDVGTLQKYHVVSQQFVGREKPFLFDGFWPLRTYYESNDPQDLDVNTLVEDSLIAPGVIARGARIVRSTVSYNTRIEPDVELVGTHHMGYGSIGRGSRLKNTIVDRLVDIPPNTVTNEDLDFDRARRLIVTPGGITYIPRGYVFR
jgi:glucose-1-phosphate adenylyltransferase